MIEGEDSHLCVKERGLRRNQTLISCQWMGSSFRVFGTLTLPTNEPVVTPDPPGVVQPAAS